MGEYRKSFTDLERAFQASWRFTGKDVSEPDS
jgi:hypothetical protein